MGAALRARWGCPGPAEAGQGAMQAVCAKCSRLMCRAVVLFLVAECAQTTPMIAPLPGDPNFSIDGSVAFFKSGESNPTQPNPPPPRLPQPISQGCHDQSVNCSKGSTEQM